MNSILGAIANSSSPEGDNGIIPLHGVFVVGKQHQALSLLAQNNRDVIRVSEWKHMIRPSSEVGTMYQGAVTTLAIIPSVTAKVLAAVAYVSGKAVKSVYRTVAWHHYIIIECVDATFKVELFRDGVQVQGILGEEVGQGQHTAREGRLRQLTKTMPGQEHPDAGTEVQSILFDGHVTTLLPLKLWMAEHMQAKYHLLEWNCQHFCDVVMALFKSLQTYA